MAFDKVAVNFKGKGQQFLGNAFVYEQEVQTKDQSFINVTKCFFLPFFQRNHAPELMPVFCALDTIWAKELNTGSYNIEFKRPSIMAEGDDMCRFQFTRVGTGKK